MSGGYRQTVRCHNKPSLVSVVGLLQITTGGAPLFTAATLWGKLPVFNLSAFALFGTYAWRFFAGSFLSLTLMRAIQGFAVTPLKTLISVTVFELFFIPEKGKSI
ncbi:hypothetical protein BKA65DRAFT_494116 [Rhexocercosporidium sp. MPI-PUGE-AT-0058]|nr:hypothetical protein BKA65DRAFT_494116 [Rhexocercosporidium sp. MPI-PUGE-AT-0058]